MQIRKDQSYGAVIFYQEGNLLKVLLIKQKTRGGEEFWIFPKGHPVDGETPEESALREVQEETGVSPCTLLPLAPSEIRYEFTWEGETIDKTATFFVGTTTNPVTKLSDPVETAQILWCPVAEVEQRLTHDNTREMWRSLYKPDLIEIVRKSLE